MANVINDIYPNVPGFVAQINDFGLAVPPTPQNLTQSVLLLGVAIDGPQNTPVAIPSLGFATQLYGTINTVTGSASGQNFQNKALIRGLYEAFQAGCTDVRVCRVGGTFASVTINDTATANSVIISAGYPGAKYNAITGAYIATGASAGVTIVTLDGVSHLIPLPAPIGQLTYGNLLYVINNSGLNVTAAQNTNGNPADLVALNTLTTTAFAGGTDGTNPTEIQYSQALNSAYNALTDYGTDIVVPMGAYLQPSYSLDGSGNPTIPVSNAGDVYYYGQNLAQFMAQMSTNFHSAIGVISIAPMLFPTFTGVNQRFAQLALTTYNFIYHSGFDDAQTGPSPVLNGADGNPVNIGRFLNIVAGPEFILNNVVLNSYVADAAATYAGQIVSLPPQNATTNKIVPNVLGLAYRYGLTQVNTLAGRAFTVFNMVNGTVRCNADNTYAPNGTVNPVGGKASDFQKLSTVRIAYAAVESVRSALQGYIGQGNTPAVSNAMATDVNSALKILKGNGSIIDYSYSITSTSTDQILGNVIVNLELVPALEIRKIYLTVQLQPPGGINITGSSATTNNG